MGTMLMLVALCVCIAGAIYFWRLICNNDPDSWVNSGVSERVLVIGAGIFVTGAIVLIVQLASSVIGSGAGSAAADKAATAPDPACVIDWEDLRVIGRYGTVEVANRSDSEQEISVVTVGGKLAMQAKLEPRRGVRLRSSIDAIKDEPDAIIWVVTKKNGASREFSFAGCDRAIADLAPNIEEFK